MQVSFFRYSVFSHLSPDTLDGCSTSVTRRWDTNSTAALAPEHRSDAFRVLGMEYQGCRLALVYILRPVLHHRHLGTVGGT